MSRSFPLAESSVCRRQFSVRQRSGSLVFPSRHTTPVARHSTRRPAAFTLIELLVVMAVIAILAGITLAGLSGAQAKGARDRTAAEISALANAIERYKMQTDEYPPPQGGTDGYLRFSDISMFMTASPGAVSGENLLDAYGNPYRYRMPGQINIATFDVFSGGPDAGNTNDDIGNW